MKHGVKLQGWTSMLDFHLIQVSMETKGFKLPLLATTTKDQERVFWVTSFGRTPEIHEKSSSLWRC